MSQAHPDLPGILSQRRRPPSLEQAEAILASAGDVLITAGAGTGKTLTLVGRYLYLLDKQHPLRSLVAITFTRKAAREMRNRIRQDVLDHLAALPPADPGRARWQEILTELDGARIGTIHSFCGDLLRSHPVEANLDPRFDVLDEGQTALLRAEAVEAALTWTAERPELASLLVEMGEPALRGLVTSLLAEGPELQSALAAIGDNPAQVLAGWAGLLAQRQTTALQDLLARSDWQERCTDLEHFAPRLPDDRLVEQVALTRAAIRGARQGAMDDRVRSLKRLLEISLVGGSQAAWPGGKEEQAAVKACLKWLREQVAGQPVLSLMLNSQDEAVAQTLVRLRPVVGKALQDYESAKAERRVLDFDDLEARAVTLLESHPDVRQQWRRQVSALLVDEFQDTNARQRRLLDELNGGGRLFLVGDAKQSIYGFRGADVTVFRQTRGSIQQNGGHVLALNETYRGHAPLVAALNALLRPVLGEQDDPARPWVEPFGTPLTAQRPAPKAGFGPPHVEVHLVVGSKSNGGLTLAAVAVAQRLVEMIETGVCKPEDIAILCRAASAFPAYEDALEAAGAPFLTIAGKGFYDRPEVRDLLNMLQALADPNDDLALAGALRSPVLGLSDAALYALAAWRDESARQDRKWASTLWEALVSKGPSLADGEDRLAARAAELIADLHRAVGRANAADVLKSFLDQTDYRAALLAAGQKRAERNVSKLLADARRSGLVKVSELLNYVRLARDVDMREGEARTLAEGSVQIMSIHQAKGLEFPVVVLGDLAYRGSTCTGYHLLDQSTLTLQHKSEDGKESPGLYTLAAGEAADKDGAEEARLLYVAATRTRERLILSGNAVWKEGKPRLEGWWKRLAAPLGFDDATWPMIDEEGSNRHYFELVLDDQPVACTVYEPKWQSIASLPPAPVMAAVVLPTLVGTLPASQALDDEQAAIDLNQPERVWRIVPTGEGTAAPQWVVGNLVHAAIAQWRFEGLDDWLLAKARGLGVTDMRELKGGVSRAKTMLRRFRQHPLWTEIDAAGIRRHETPYSWQDGDRIEQGVIDVLYRRAERWNLVDFKTDRLKTLYAPSDEKYLAYVKQLRNYLRATSVLLGATPTGFLCFLDVAGAIALEPVILTGDGEGLTDAGEGLTDAGQD